MTSSPPTSRRLERFIPPLLYLAAFGLYTATAAPGTLFGDPSEYQFIPAVLGIAHPPGYAFYTLLARLWQVVVPVGSIAWRTNLLAGAVGAWGVTAVYLIVREAQIAVRTSPAAARYLPCALFAALCLAVAPDFWQHAIHANAHVVSAALALTHLWLLTRWWRTGRDGWLAAFAVMLGLAATHHPITLFGIPAYAIFILTVRRLQWRTLALLVGCGLLGLLPLLYYPLRSPSAPFGPTDMRTWAGFWRHLTAQGLRGNLFHFGWADQLDRIVVFWSLLRLQYLVPVILLVAAGAAWLARRVPRVALLIGLFVLTHLLFTLNTVQDVMAYLLIPFAALAVTAGAGAVALAERVSGRRSCALLLVSFFLWPLLQGGLNLSRGISLRDFTAAEEWVAAVHRRFDGQGEGAVLLSDWEHLTPLWVHAYTQDEEIGEEDVRLVYVSTANPWVASAWANIEAGPVYLPDARPALRHEGFRLVPEGDFYRVVAPPVSGVAPAQPLDVWADGRLHVLGYDLPATTVRAGEPLTLILYQGVAEPLAGIWMPYAQLGPVEARWTTDSRLLTPQWLAGEIVVERYELPVPFHLPAGDYPLRLGYADLSGGRAQLSLGGAETLVDLATICVLPAVAAPPERVLEQALANLDNQVALMGARARAGGQARRAPWEEPLAVRAGGALHLTLTWQALVSPRDSLTVFIHLLDGAGQYVAGHDYTPLGGAAPTYLWFPKWLPGQVFSDPYRLSIPADLPPGDYWLEVGMYGMTSLQRLPVVDWAGNLAGDRVILGSVQVTGP
ncbi:MAG: DUF2723 domain-containing protein [Anaerolineae bacterium]|nr:DUF2723 domain-containing protein [Anaerolineae bacterium]